jgi:hypothetical protein
VKIPLILRKILENMAAESGSLPLKVGEFTCMPGKTAQFVAKVCQVWFQKVMVASVRIWKSSFIHELIIVSMLV